jgi:hypothetical protein
MADDTDTVESWLEDRGLDPDLEVLPLEGEVYRAVATDILPNRLCASGVNNRGDSAPILSKSGRGGSSAPAERGLVSSFGGLAAKCSRSRMEGKVDRWCFFPYPDDGSDIGC